jgi:hypothetical protein
MSDDIEQRLTAAAQAVRELEVTRQRCSDLQSRQDQLSTELAGLRAQYLAEQTDVDRLEHMSLTRVLVALKGSREQTLSREQAEADASRMRVADAQARLEAVRNAYEAADERLHQLSSAPAAYASVLAAKEQHLTSSDDPRRAVLLNLADERGRLNAEISEMNKALQAAHDAQQALSVVADKLSSASGWNTFDTFFRGGMIATAMEHSQLDDAAQAASAADQHLAVLRTDLTELDELAETAPMITLSSGTRFVDMWFNNIFTDLAVRDQINAGQENVTRSAQMVSAIQGRLTAQSEEAQNRLTQIEARRRELLTQ